MAGVDSRKAQTHSNVMACELDFEAMMREERARRKRQTTKPKPTPAVPHTKQNLCSDSDLPDSVTIIEDFVTEAEAAALTEAAQRGKWVVMPNRRVQNLGGTPHPDGDCTAPSHYSQVWIRYDRATVASIHAISLRRDGLEWTLPTSTQPLPAERVRSHCLSWRMLTWRRYAPGGGIAAHRDGPR